MQTAAVSARRQFRHRTADAIQRVRPRLKRPDHPLYRLVEQSGNNPLQQGRPEFEIDMEID